MPYSLSLGPTITGTQAQPPSGDTVKVVARADDDAYGDSGVGRPTPVDVVAARIYVGVAPWDGGTAVPMNIKGSGTSITASRKVHLGAQQQLAWVQAQNANGYWGPVQALWIPAA